MGLSSLLRFTNATDIKQGIRNPNKAARLVYRHLRGKQSTSITDPSVFTEEQITVIEELFDSERHHVEQLLEELRTSPHYEHIQACHKEVASQPFSLGGMNLGGEISYLVVRLLEPDTILEIGVANGVSTAYVLGALDDNDHEADIRAIDRPRFVSDIQKQRGKRGLQGVGGIIPNEKEAGWVAPREQRSEHGYQYYVGNFLEILPSVVDSMAPLDVAIYDASKDAEEMEMAYETLIQSLAPGGVLLSDDIGVNNMFEQVTSRYDGETVMFSGYGIFRIADQS